MPWARLDDHADQDPTLMKLSDAAFRLWVVGLIYCARALTDGFIDAVMLPMLRARRGVVDELCLADLWIRVDGGFRVRNYLSWNDSAETVRSNRKKSRDRMQRHRDGGRDGVRYAVTKAECAASVTMPHSTTTTTTKKNGEASGELVGFEDFIRVYPRQDERSRASTVWRSIDPDQALAKTIVATAARFRDLPATRRTLATVGGVELVPLAANWLRDRRWTDASVAVIGVCE